MSTISVRQFLQMFTVAERVGIYAAEAGNPVLRQWLELLRAGSDVDMSSLETVTGLDALVSMSLLTAERRAEFGGVTGSGPHTLAYLGVVGGFAHFRCMRCMQVIDFALPGQGEPAAVPDGGGYLPPEAAETWMGECA